MVVTTALLAIVIIVIAAWPSQTGAVVTPS
jgi:hypothetical protein